MSPILSVAVKDLRVLTRRRGDLFFVLGWPVLLAALLGLIFAAPPEGRARIEVVVVDEDGTSASHAFVERLRATGGLDVSEAERDEAALLVRQGRRAAWLALRPGFGDALRRPLGGTPPRVEVGIDPSRTAETAMLEGLLLREAAADMQARLGDRDASRRMIAESLGALRAAPPWSKTRQDTERFLVELDRFLARDPGDGGGAPRLEPLLVERTSVVPQTRGPSRSFDFTFPQGILWGILACAASFAVSLVGERTSGTMDRLLTAPLGRGQLLAGKALGCLLAMLAMQAFVLAVGVALFGVRPASWVLLAAACLSSAVAFVGIMMVLAVLGRTEQSANGSAWAALLVMALLGGGMVPLFVMPGFMLTASHLSPAKWAILAFEGALWRGFSPAEMAVPCAILVGVGVIGFLLGTRLLRTA
jgi:linearmycin/streptolysin S transport system permease protein